MKNVFDLLILLCLFLPVVLMAVAWLGGDRQPMPPPYPEGLAAAAAAEPELSEGADAVSEATEPLREAA